jgi:hypothetical protein
MLFHRVSDRSKLGIVDPRIRTRVKIRLAATEILKMTEKKRKIFSGEQRAKVALVAIKGVKSAAGSCNSDEEN